MVAAKYKSRIFIAVPVIFTMYVILTDMIPVDHTKGWIYLPSDLTNSTVFGERTLNATDGSCVFMNSDRRKNEEVNLRVIIITYDRPSSLHRLLKSLNEAHYGKDRVLIEIWLDRSKIQRVHNQTLQTARTFKFDQGKCSVHVHPNHVGIKGQWLSTWIPMSNSTEIAVILEDDLTVSPHFYTYLKLVHRKYGHRHDITGFSLQGNSMRHSDGKCCLNVPLENKVFLYPTLGTSGFSPNTRNWLQFLVWYKELLRNGIHVPLIENHIALKWYKVLSKKGQQDSMWEMEYLYYTRKKSEYSLYPNFPDHRGLTFNWFENGLHSTGERITNREEERKNLVLEWTLNYTQLADVLVYLDDNGNIVQ